MAEVTNDLIYRAVMELHGKMGGVQAGVANNTSFITAVSKKSDIIRGELNSHRGDQGAHGLAGERRGFSFAHSLIALVAGVIGAAVSVFTFLKFFAPFAKAAGGG